MERKIRHLNLELMEEYFIFIIKKDVYLKGANYIPPEMSLPRALKNPSIYERIF